MKSHKWFLTSHVLHAFECVVCVGYAIVVVVE